MYLLELCDVFIRRYPCFQILSGDMHSPSARELAEVALDIVLLAINKFTPSAVTRKLAI